MRLTVLTLACAGTVFAQAPAENVAAVYLNYPSNPAAVAVPEGAFEDAVAYAETTGAAMVHDFAYGDLVFDGRSPRSFLATPGAKEVGVEMFSMSKSYGMAGWRVGFVVGNAEIVERINLLNDHSRVGIFRPIQEACIAALLKAGPRATRLQKKLIRQWEELPVSGAIAAGIDCFADAYATVEPARMMRAFLDRPRG